MSDLTPLSKRTYRQLSKNWDFNLENSDVDTLVANELNGLSDVKSTKVTSKSGLFNAAMDSSSSGGSMKLNFSKEDDGGEGDDYGGSSNNNKPSIGFSTANTFSIHSGSTGYKYTLTPACGFVCTVAMFGLMTMTSLPHSSKLFTACVPE